MFVYLLSLLRTLILLGQTEASETTLSTRREFIRGRDGAPGRDGRDGIVGPQGSPGFSGFPGLKGELGEQGKPGAKGAKGDGGNVTSSQGSTGPPGLQGPKGNTGMQGPRGQNGSPGTPASSTGGVTYTKWGNMSCRAGATRLYAGRVGASAESSSGGGSNYMCMPNDPEYSTYRPGVQGRVHMYGVEYEGPPLVSNREQHNAPCAVCYVSNKATQVMIPARNTCPNGWTEEYHGYLMTERSNTHRTEFVCVDSTMESVVGSQNNIYGAHFYHVEAHCNGMACPPYNNYKELICVLCSN